MNKKESKIRRATKTRMHIRKLGVTRLCINKTPRHMYAQVTTPDGAKVLASASTLVLRKQLKGTGNIEAAKMVGKLIAEEAIKAGVSKVAFDRSGLPFHGRVKALAEAAREAGLEF